MRVLLDTDVILDMLADRQPFVVEASVLWLAHEQGRLEAFVSPITPVNVFYLLRKQLGALQARQIVGRLLTTLSICPLDQTVLASAHALPMADFEDAVQAAAATAAQLDALVTRNTRDYARHHWRSSRPPRRWLACPPPSNLQRRRRAKSRKDEG